MNRVCIRVLRLGLAIASATRMVSIWYGEGANARSSVFAHSFALEQADQAYSAGVSDGLVAFLCLVQLFTCMRLQVLPDLGLRSVGCGKTGRGRRSAAKCDVRVSVSDLWHCRKTAFPCLSLRIACQGLHSW